MEDCMGAMQNLLSYEHMLSYLHSWHALFNLSAQLFLGQSSSTLNKNV